jgi:3-hydroxyisobutyrate dehydrogenase-like beta-hydroxyacid dehydrogenase
LLSITEGEVGLLAGLSADRIYIDMSTVSPKVILSLAVRVAGTGAEMLEAPVSGSIPAAESGTLILYVGGKTETLERARPVLEQISQKIIYVGSSGQAIAVKVAINLNLPIQLVSLFEGVLLAEHSGVPRAEALDALLNSVAASTAMKYRAPFMLKMPDEVWFSADMMKKDIQLALELGKETGVALTTARLVDELLDKAIAMGWGGQDFAVLYRVVELLSSGKDA